MNPLSCTGRKSAVFASVVAVAAMSLVLAGCGASTGSGASPTSGGHTSSGPASGGGTSGGGTSDVSAFFPVAVGNTWVYQTSSAAGQGRGTSRITAVTPTTGGQLVTMAVSTKLPGQTAPSKAGHVTFIFHADGSISVPLTQFAGSSVKVKSGGVLWPSQAQLASGQPNADTIVLSVTEAGHTITVKEHVVVKGGGTASVTVPAGTYQATVINETMTSGFGGTALNLEVRTWVATGVGPVKSEVLSTSGGKTVTDSTQVLESFTKG